MLGPDEQFTVNSLSGEVPKKPHVIKSLGLLLGPDFMTDLVVVETSDHARLSLKLSYNWFFDVDRKHPSKIFAVPDFVGDACKAIASRVRGAVARTTFDNFHKHSADLIREAVFGKEGEQVLNRFVFHQNNLTITNIDIQSVEPVDSRTRDALQKSVQLAIEITTIESTYKRVPLSALVGAKFITESHEIYQPQLSKTKLLTSLPKRGNMHGLA
jgi:major vault protein